MGVPEDPVKLIGSACSPGDTHTITTNLLDENTDVGTNYGFDTGSTYSTLIFNILLINCLYSQFLLQMSQSTHRPVLTHQVAKNKCHL